MKSSSISSSDVQLSSGPEIVRRGLTVTAALAVVLVASWFVLEPWTKRTNHMLMAVESLSPETEVLVLGTSHVDCGIDPSGFDLKLMNLSGIAANYVCLEGVSDAHLDDLPGLRLVVIEADIFPLRYDTLSVLDGDFTRLLDLAPSVLAMDIPWKRKVTLLKDQWLHYSPLTAPFLARDKLMPTVVRERVRRRSFAPEIDVCGTGEAEIFSGFRAFDQVLSGANDGTVKVSTHERESSRDVAANVAANTKSLERIIASVLARGLPVVLLRMPHHSTYRSHRPPEMNEQYATAMAGIASRFAPAIAEGQVRVWDMEAMAGLTDQDFYDGDHLNGRGAKRFTRELSRRLNAALADLSGAPQAR